MPAPKPSLHPAQIPINSEATDPDSEVEWITPDNKNDNDGSIQFPEPLEIPSSKEGTDLIWPFVFMNNPRENSKPGPEKLPIIWIHISPYKQNGTPSSIMQ